MTRKAKQRVLHILLYMVLTVIAVIALFPLFYIILASFRTDEEIFKYALPFTIHTIVPVALFLPLQKYFVQGVTSSGVKG